MLFYSTNNQAPKVDFETALMQGLAPDGGLYFPEKIPQFSESDLSRMRHASLKDVGAGVLKKWLGEYMSYQEVQDLAARALNFPVKLIRVHDYYVLELFHGPTMSFKDIAASCLAHIMDFFLKKRNTTATILVATSGDTGGAVAQGFANTDNVQLVILYPKGKVSKLQEEQLTRVNQNVYSLAVDGSFDDCQALVKAAFSDGTLKHLNLTSANSINIGRLIPQTIYYVYTYMLLYSSNIEFVVPVGNLGNLTAGIFSAQLRLPFTSFIAGTNSNDALYKYYKTGKYHPQKTVTTLSNAMDVGNPSNFSRLMELFKNRHDSFKSYIKATSVSEKDTIETIKKVYSTHNYLLDPHSAVAWKAAEELANPDMIQVVEATASPVKFAAEIKQETGIEVDNSTELAKLQSKIKRVFELKNDYQDFKHILLKKL